MSRRVGWDSSGDRSDSRARFLPRGWVDVGRDCREPRAVRVARFEYRSKDPCVTAIGHTRETRSREERASPAAPRRGFFPREEKSAASHRANRGAGGEFLGGFSRPDGGVAGTHPLPEAPACSPIRPDSSKTCDHACSCALCRRYPARSLARLANRRTPTRLFCSTRREYSTRCKPESEITPAERASSVKRDPPGRERHRADFAEVDRG